MPAREGGRVTSSVRPTLRKNNLKSEIADYLREQIYGGALHAGSRLDQDGLADELGVSRLPVREALISLEAEGLVVTKARRGAYVASLTEADVIDHFRIFGAVCSIAAQEATDALTAAQLDKLDGLVADMETAKDFEQISRLNDQFHAEINRAGSHRLRSVLRLLAGTMPARFYEFAEGWETSAHSEHREIVAALRAGDPDRATAATRTHFERNGELAVKVLRDNGFWARPAG
jgi:DNA-binding GntR family transcriptional regulator